MAGEVSTPLEVRVERLGAEGEGIATDAGRALFVAGGLPGERVRVRLVEEGRVRRATLEAILEESPARREPPCALADRCGGCDWMHLRPGAQVEAKERIVREALERIGRVDLARTRILPTAGAGTDTGTRRRAVLHWEAGALTYYGRRSHRPVPVAECPALVPALVSLPGRLAPLLAGAGRALRDVHLLAEGDAVTLALSVDGPVRPALRRAATGLVRGELARGVVLLPSAGAAEEVGRPVLEAPAPLQAEVRLRMRADGFVQAHPEGTSQLVARALELLGPSSGDRALELYAGSGTFTFALAARVAAVVAVESSAVAVSLGAAAGRAARVANVRWVQGDAARVADGLVREAARFDLILADPPRTGAPALARLASALGVQRLVYVGCDAGSLSRDAGRLVQAGFRFEALQLVDLFPNTHHVEALLLFSR